MLIAEIGRYLNKGRSDPHCDARLFINSRETVERKSAMICWIFVLAHPFTPTDFVLKA
jgi:hypothetical protein